MTGFVVWAATTPGSAAAIPATAMNTSALLSSISFTSARGVRCAEQTLSSYATPNSSSVSQALPRFRCRSSTEDDKDAQPRQPLEMATQLARPI